ncbi:MAG TPA: hypothetical protein VK760_08695 [Candidatus Acidoferrales bacterium]|jgi:hypothetical protein|nr:hypothetical protein [Candidatus Acidoferrales bacterium]
MLARLFALVGLIAIAACAGQRGLPAVSSLQAMPGVEPQANTVVQGTIVTTSWVVPKGKTWSVGAKGIAVFAKSITIDGTLQVASGRHLVLLAPTIHINGKIAASDSGTTRTGSATVSDVIGACALQIGTPKTATAIPLAIPPGDRLYVSATSANCTFDVYGYVVTSSGRNGSPKIVAVRAGETGGSIDIGTKTANAQTQAAAKSIKEKVTTHAIKMLAIEGTISAGWGGAGANDTKGKFDEGTGTWSYNAGAGAPGGDVSIQAQTYMPLGSTAFAVTAGRGGNGGAIGAPSLDGTAAKPNGGNISIVQSAGGRGGIVTLLGTASGQPPTSAGGAGGNAGTVSAAAGDGWSPLGGHGGNVDLTLAQPGPGGWNAAHVPGMNGSYPVMAFGGGNGGSGALGAVGGPGGSFVLVRPSAAPALPPSTITFYGFNGGAGGPKCGNGNVGAAGGAGGNFSENAKNSDFAVIFEGSNLFSAFSGGKGGNGGIDSPGAGGAAGKAYFNGTYVQAAGTTGNPGNGC